MIYKKKASKVKRRLKKYLIVFLMLLIAVVIFFEYQAVPFQKKYIKTQAKIISNDAITKAVNEVIEKYNYSYADITEINYDKNGKVVSISTNPETINKLKVEMNKAVQKEIETVTDADVSLNIGAFTELSLLSSWGPKVTFDFTFIGSFNSDIV